MSDRFARARETGTFILLAVVDDAKIAIDAAASDALLAVVAGARLSRVCDELAYTIAERAVEALDDDDLRAIAGQSPTVLASKAAPGGPWRDWRGDRDADVSVADVIRGTLESGIRAHLREHLDERLREMRGDAA